VIRTPQWDFPQWDFPLRGFLFYNEKRRKKMRYKTAIRLFGYDETEQTIQLARLEGISPSKALDKLAHDMGYIRWRNPISGQRQWVKENIYLQYRSQDGGYRHSSIRHKMARNKISPKRRKEIAAMGAAARKRKLQMQKELQNDF
jgi:hypothetical protein